MTKPALYRDATNTRLFSVDLPGVEVEDARLAVLPVDPLDAPARHRIRQQPEIAATRGRQVAAQQDRGRGENGGANDVSARDIPNGGQWMYAKSFDTFAPMGPWIVTADEIADPQDLPIRARLNGNVLQESNTTEMIFPVRELIAYVSRGITLEPGDVILTGTPAGVGVARTPNVWLKPGDTIEVEIEGIGALRNPVA